MTKQKANSKTKPLSLDMYIHDMAFLHHICEGPLSNIQVVYKPIKTYSKDPVLRIIHLVEKRTR